MLGRCPRCSSSLTEVHHDEVHLVACGGCGGVWMHGATLDRFVTALQAQPGAVDAARRASQAALFAFEPDPEVLACPVCGRGMEITRHPSGIALDVCADHGVWFDRHELPKVVSDPDGLAAVTAAHDHVVPRASAPPPGVDRHSSVALDALWVTAEVADAVATSGGDPSDLVDVVEGGVSLAGGALELLGELGSGAVELVFGVLSVFE